MLQLLRNNTERELARPILEWLDEKYPGLRGVALAAAITVEDLMTIKADMKNQGKMGAFGYAGEMCSAWRSWHGIAPPRAGARVQQEAEDQENEKILALFDSQTPAEQAIMLSRARDGKFHVTGRADAWFMGRRPNLDPKGKRAKRLLGDLEKRMKRE